MTLRRVSGTLPRTLVTVLGASFVTLSLTRLIFGRLTLRSSVTESSSVICVIAARTGSFSQKSLQQIAHTKWTIVYRRLLGLRLHTHQAGRHKSAIRHHGTHTTPVRRNHHAGRHRRTDTTVVAHRQPGRNIHGWIVLHDTGNRCLLPATLAVENVYQLPHLHLIVRLLALCTGRRRSCARRRCDGHNRYIKTLIHVAFSKFPSCAL